jgi:putative transcriptional regulator
MPIKVRLAVLLAERGIKGVDLAEKIGITAQNLSILRTGKARAIRFSTLEALCRELDCRPGDLLSYEPDDDEPGGD